MGGDRRNRWRSIAESGVDGGWSGRGMWHQLLALWEENRTELLWDPVSDNGLSTKQDC